MEPDELLGGEPAAGADELQRIVAKAAKRRWRALAGAAVVALGAGAGIGYGVSNHSSPAQTVVAGSSPATTTGTGAEPAIASAGNYSNPGVVGSPNPTQQRFTHLFTRTVGSTTIRGYLTNLQFPKMPAGATGCEVPFFGPAFQAEVSTPDAVGQVVGMTGSTSSSIVRSVDTESLGELEGSPVTIVAVYTDSTVAKVRISWTGGGTDEMAPVRGWAALAGPASSSKTAGIGTLEALGSSGQVLKSMSVNFGMSPEPGGGPLPACMCPLPPVMGGGTSSSGSSGSVSSGTAQAPNKATFACPVIKGSPPPVGGIGTGHAGGSGSGSGVVVPQTVGAPTPANG